MKDWNPPYIETQVKPVTVLQSNEGVKMKRFDPILRDDGYTEMYNLSDGDYVEYSEVQNMIIEILHHLHYSFRRVDDIEKTIKNAGFEVKE